MKQRGLLKPITIHIQHYKAQIERVKKFCHFLIVLFKKREKARTRFYWYADDIRERDEVLGFGHGLFPGVIDKSLHLENQILWELADNGSDKVSKKPHKRMKKRLRRCLDEKKGSQPPLCLICSINC